MKTTRQTVVKPLGLMTTPNQYGVFPAGAMETASGVVMRAPGMLLAAPGVTDTVTVGSANTDSVQKLMPLDGGHVYSWTRASGDVWTVLENGNAVTLPSLISTTGLWGNGSGNGRIWPVRARERMLVNSNEGVFVGDFMAPTNSTQRALRMAGLPQPQFLVVAVIGNTGGTQAIPVNVMVAYAAVITRSFSDGYVVKSVPSPIAKLLNSTVLSQNISVGVGWAPSSGVAAGDVVEIYRTDGLPSATVTSDPGTTLKLIQSATLTSTDISNGFVGFVDATIMSAPFYTTSGRALYTNPGQEGSTGSNRQPDINGAQAVFKGFTFYGNITERPQWVFGVPGGIGNTIASAQNTVSFRTFGIGNRTGAGTITNGSNTITGISATDIIGLKIGQFWDAGTPPFPLSAKITAVGATTVTMSVNASGAASTFGFSDSIELSNSVGTFFVNYGQRGVGQMFESFASAVNNGANAVANYELTTNQSYLDDTNSLGDTAPTLVVTVEPSRPNFSSTFTVRATNGANYSPPIPEITATAQTFSATNTPNLLKWSKDSEPEHVPAVNETRVGSAAIISLVATKDALWIFCTDGIYRLSGDAGVWRVDVVAPGCVLCAPQCAVNLREVVYAYTNQGFVMVTDSGTTPISDSKVKSLAPGPPFAEIPNIIVEKNDKDQEVILVLGFSGFFATTMLVYSAQFDVFTQVTGGTNMDGLSALAYQDHPASGNAVLLIGNSVFSVSLPVYSSWGTSSAQFLAATAHFRPFFDKDPMVVKQWIDATFLFDAADLGKVLTSRFSTVTAGVITLVRTVGDAVGTVGVPRARCIDTSCRPGFTLPAAATQFKFRGVSLRYTPFTYQQLRR